jgi:hypothetical protein
MGEKILFYDRKRHRKSLGRNHSVPTQRRSQPRTVEPDLIAPTPQRSNWSVGSKDICNLVANILISHHLNPLQKVLPTRNATIPNDDPKNPSRCRIEVTFKHTLVESVTSGCCSLCS